MKMRLLTVAAIVALLPIAAETAPKLCGDRDEIIDKLLEKHDESPRAMGLGRDGGVIEVMVSPEGGWTILVTYPGQPSCVIAVGEAWQTLPAVLGDPV